MKLQFTKMHGCGNDYIYFNCFDQQIDRPEELAKAVSDRHFGIGGDGIVLICPSDAANAKMRMFNADGSEGNMCGNAIRCVGKYLYDHDIVKKRLLSIETRSGIKFLDLQLGEDGLVSGATVNMGKAVLDPAAIPVNMPGDRVIAEPAKIDRYEYKITCVSMGNPHCVVFGDNPDLLDLSTIGPLFENSPLFPERVNTEFVQVTGPDSIKMRVWERGSGETLACGTGACASVVAAVENRCFEKDQDITVQLTGGQLTVNYNDDRVLMTGPATVVFTGEIDI